LLLLGVCKVVEGKRKEEAVRDRPPLGAGVLIDAGTGVWLRGVSPSSLSRSVAMDATDMDADDDEGTAQC